eukprot:gene3622-10575_t
MARRLDCPAAMGDHGAPEYGEARAGELLPAGWTECQ